MQTVSILTVERALEVNFSDMVEDVSLPADEMFIERERRYMYVGRELADIVTAGPSVVAVHHRPAAPDRNTLVALSILSEFSALCDGAVLSRFARDLVPAAIRDLRRAPDAEAHFRELLNRWHKERGISSSTTKILLCPSYQQIIGMGEKALPLIFKRLKEEGDDPDHWFWALESIAGENPVPQELWGRGRDMARIWLAWGRQHGY